MILRLPMRASEGLLDGLLDCSHNTNRVSTRCNCIRDNCPPWAVGTPVRFGSSTICRASTGPTPRQHRACEAGPSPQPLFLNDQHDGDLEEMLREFLPAQVPLTGLRRTRSVTVSGRKAALCAVG